MNIRTNLLAVVDQGAVSLGNFLMVFFLARVLVPTDYGVFAIFFGIMLLLNSIHAALVIYPLSLEAAVTRSEELATAVTTGFEVTVLLTSLESLVLGLACFVLHRWDLMAVTVVALLLWQMQETSRRGLTAQFRFREALDGDAVSYIGQFLAMVVLSSTHRLTLFNIFAVIGATSLLALVMQASRTGVVAPLDTNIGSSLRRYLRLGRWTVLSHMVAMVPAIPMYVCFVGMFFNYQDAGVMQALGNVLGITNPFLLAMLALIVPAAAKAHGEKGLAAAWEVSSKYGKRFAMVILPYYLALFLAPGLVTSLFYGLSSRYLRSALFLRWLVLAYAFTYVAQVMGGFLRAIERMEVDFAANTAAAVAVVISFIFAATHYGPLVSVAFSFVLATALRVAILSWWTVRITRAAKQEGIAVVAVS